MDRIAIITARGGSKRIPKKNIKSFCGKPIIVYSIKAALESGRFDEVMVSTESREIAEIAKEAGAQVPFFRSEETSNDYATTAEVLLEVLKEYKIRGKEFQVGCCIYPTAPFVTSEKLIQGLRILEKEAADTVLPVVPFSFPPQRGLKIQEHVLSPVYPEYMNARSQDLEKWYHDCGQFYCFNIKSFLKTKNLIGKSTVPFIMDELEVQDIDNLADWKLAELKYKLMMEGQNEK